MYTVTPQTVKHCPQCHWNELTAWIMVPEKCSMDHLTGDWMVKTVAACDKSGHPTVQDMVEMPLDKWTFVFTCLKDRWIWVFFARLGTTGHGWNAFGQVDLQISCLKDKWIWKFLSHPGCIIFGEMSTNSEIEHHLLPLSGIYHGCMLASRICR